ncbi:MAG: glycosyltransferase family 39 protein [Chloroflexi bacterium]|nr:glycosyltransferase family 39 protein [Chloroflexota bacterium]
MTWRARRAPSWTLVLLTVITLTGGVLRLWDLDGWQYGLDELEMTGLASQIAAGRALPTGIAASVGIPNGPVAPYALAIPSRISTSLWSVESFWAVCGTAAIPLMYSLTRSLFGNRAGLISAALFAVNPWLVVFDRRLWLNALIAPTAVLFLWTLQRAARRDSILAWIGAGVALSLSVQTHLSGIANAAAVGALLPAAGGFSRRGLAVGGAAGLALMVPWLVGSAWPAVVKLDLHNAAASPGWTLESLNQATLLVTGVAYQNIADARLDWGGLGLDATAFPFNFVDYGARGLAGIGWLWLIWTGWKTRSDHPATAVTCLVAAAMVAVPVAVLARPPEIGNVASVFAHYFINVAPPLLLGIGGLSALPARPLALGASVGSAIIIGTQLLLALPFFATPQTEWHLGDFTLPWRFTDQLVTEMRNRAAGDRIQVMVGGAGYAEQGTLAATLLRREYDLVRIHDGRDGIVFWNQSPRLLLVTSRDDQTMARFLRSEFGSSEVFTQELPGGRWTHRIFDLASSALDNWATTHLVGAPSTPGSPTVRYQAAGFVPPQGSDHGPMLAVLWRFQAEPLDHFFTDVMLLSPRGEIHRERHVAYPIAFWEPGDWRNLEILNLFQLPPALDTDSVTSIRFEHVGILSGRPTSPPIEFVVTPLPLPAR